MGFFRPSVGQAWDGTRGTCALCRRCYRGAYVEIRCRDPSWEELEGRLQDVLGANKVEME